jgi:hypothetical protein
MDLQKQQIHRFLIHYYRFYSSKIAAADLGITNTSIMSWFSRPDPIPKRAIIKLKNLHPALRDRKLANIQKKIDKMEAWKLETIEQAKTFDLQLNAILADLEKGKKIPKELEDFDLRSLKPRQKDA